MLLSWPLLVSRSQQRALPKVEHRVVIEVNVISLLTLSPHVIWSIVCTMSYLFERSRALLVVAALLLSMHASAEVVFDAASGPAGFAAREIEAALRSRNEHAFITLKLDPAGELKAEGFLIQQGDAGIQVIGKDAAGVMYGGLDLAETIRSEGVEAVRPKRLNPYMPMRGVKFNIPLDARCPTYSAFSDATEHNTAHMWDLAFWKEYIDTLAIYRYNFVSLWSLHPFPMMVKVPEYPDIALDDVKLSQGPFQDYYRGTMPSTWAKPIIDVNNLTTIRTMTIDDKIAFWRQVMAYGKSRNVDVYLMTWNIFTCGVDGKHGINDDPANEITIDYFRKSVKALMLTYPDLAGIGLTAGENMYADARLHAQEAAISAEAKEDWVAKTYAAGILDALKEQPERRIRFIHRQHQASSTLIMDKMKALRDHPHVDFTFSVKYAEAHVYSATRQPGAKKFTPPGNSKVKTLWTLRNDDIYLFRWAAPDFVREFIKNIPLEVTQGCYYGHDGFVNGREFTQHDPESPRQLEIKKHWLQWMLWGRLTYDPDYSNERIIRLLGARYPEVDGGRLLDAWQKASMVYPLVTGFHWASLDSQWYIEGMRGRYEYTSKHGGKATSGFHYVETFINLPPHPYAGVRSIPDFVAGKPSSDSDPLALADLIDQNVEAAHAGITGFGNVTSKELRQTLDDVDIICEMGRYYADKIRGATYVATARVSGRQTDKDQAIQALVRASGHYDDFTKLVTRNHVDRIRLSRVGMVDFIRQRNDVMADVDIARKIAVRHE